MRLDQEHHVVTQVIHKPVAPRSRVKHSTTEPLHSLLSNLVEKWRKGQGASIYDVEAPIFWSMTGYMTGCKLQKWRKLFFETLPDKKITEIIYYSNFDKHHYKDFHRAQSTQPTPLALDNFWPFSSNSTKFSVVIENAVGYSFSLTRRSHGCRWNVTFFSKISPKNLVNFSLMPKDQKHDMSFQPFYIHLKPVCYWYCKFWTQ